MTDDVRDRLLAITAQWRETAAIWERHRLAKWPQDQRPRTRPMPPTKARGDIHNWENWLRSCADEVESALGAKQ